MSSLPQRPPAFENPAGTLPDFFMAGQAVRGQRRIDKTETGEAREGCPAVALAVADQTIGG